MMKEDNEKSNIVVLPYKDAHLNELWDQEDFLKWLENPILKEEIDKCLNELRKEI